jgi:hypothetical protein
LGRKKTRRLTPPEFAGVMALIARMSLNRREAARLALVEGHTAQSIAQRYGWRRTSVNNAEKAVWLMHQRYVAAKRAEAIAARRLEAWM